MGLQVKIVKYFSAAEQFSCRAANFPAAFRGAGAERRKCQFPNGCPPAFQGFICFNEQKYGLTPFMSMV
jgi:hypothetical protein